MGGAVADAPGSKNSTPDSKFIVVAPVVTWMAAETRSRAAAPLRGPRAEALKGILKGSEDTRGSNDYSGMIDRLITILWTS